MQLKVNEEGRTHILKYSIVAIIGVTTFFIFYRFDEIKGWFDSLISLLFPFIFGFAIAFLLDKPMLLIERGCLKIGLKKRGARNLAAIAAIIFGIWIVFSFFSLLIPQLFESIFNLIDSAPLYIAHFIEYIEKFIEHYEIDTTYLIDWLGPNYESEFITNLTNFFTNYVPQMISLTGRVTNGLLNTVLGVMAGLYIMLEKEKFILGVKRLTYAFASKSTADYLVRFSKITASVFNNFIIGKAIDSLIIGILTYILMSILKLPYTLLLSVIVGITNMIPVFGPFIGAVPGVIILTLIHPLQGLYFAILILLIQQFDGNILGPIILGDKLGLPSLAILFAVCIGGGLFGIVGMFIGVPIFAVIYQAVSEVVDARLKKKELTIE